MTAPLTSAQPHPETLELLARLVAFPTISATSNLALIDDVEAYLASLGYVTRSLPNQTGDKAGLMAHRGSTTGGVMLSAHSDVVPVEGQNWTRPPFTLTREGNRLYGRGTTDMKGFLAAMLSAAARASAQDLPLMLCISYDEEVGCTGMRDMIPEIAALGWSPDLCIVGEPTSMQPAVGHKGKAAFRARFTGHSGHSALAPKYVNALHLAADFITILRAAQADFAENGAKDAAYAIPYSTVHAGKLQGGTALNIVPESAVLEFELRHMPSETPATFLAKLREQVEAMLAPYRAQHAGVGVEIVETNAYPGLDCPESDPALARLLSLTGMIQPTKVAYGTEAGFFAAAGIPTLVCGPGDMEGQGHKADEYLDVSELAACDAFLDKLLAQLAR